MFKQRQESVEGIIDVKIASAVEAIGLKSNTWRARVLPASITAWLV
jgi:hypothetical protein